MKVRNWMAATALALAVTSVAPALVDGASAAAPQSGVGVGSAVTLHKVHGKVVHVHHHKHRHPRHH